MANEKRIYFLDALRAAAIFMVVASHARGYCPGLTQAQGRIIFFILSICVPIFFLVDGYLFADGSMRRLPFRYGEYVRKSAFRLLLPWTIFTVFYALVRYPLEQTGFLTEKLIVGKPFATILVFAWGSVYAGQLYFLVSLFLIRLAAPATRRMCEMKGAYALMICVAFYGLYKLGIDRLNGAIGIPGGQEPFLHALWGAQFYLLGVLLRLYSRAVARTSPGVAAISLGMLIALDAVFPGFLTPGKSPAQHLYLLGAFALFLTVYGDKTGTSRIGTNTMGIYLLHAPLLMKAVSTVGAKLPLPPLAIYLVVSVAVSVAAYCLTEIVRRLPYGSWLFGISDGRTNAGPGKTGLAVRV